MWRATARRVAWSQSRDGLAMERDVVVSDELAGPTNYGAVSCAPSRCTATATVTTSSGPATAMTPYTWTD